MVLSTENKAYELLVALFEEAKETLKNQEEGDKEAKEQRKAKREERTKAGNEFQTLSRNISEWEKWKTTRGSFALDAQLEKWEELFGEDPNWDGETELIPFFRSKVTELREDDLVKAQDRIVSLDEDLADIEDRLSDPDIAKRRQAAARVDVGGASAEEIIDWLVGDADDNPDLVFRDELQALSEGQTDFESAGTFVYDNRLSRAQNKKLREAFERGEVLAPQEGAGRLLSYEGRLQLKEAIDDSLAPYSGPQLSAGEELSESEIVRETPIGAGTSQTRGPQGPPSSQTTGTSDPMQTGLEEGLAAQRDLIEQARGRARVTDPRQVVPEFGAPAMGGVTSGGGVVGSGDEQDPALDLSSRLGDIGSAFNISDQFGYRYFLFEPGTENERQDMLIDDPDNPGTQINVLEYITSKNLTNEAEILEAFKQTEWFNETSEIMQNFDLAWDAAGPWDNWDNLTARREELIGNEKDYIEDQLELLGITDEVDEAEINKLATFVKRNGMDTSEIRDYLSDVESIDFQSYIAEADTGLLATYKGSLATTAASYMVELDDDQLNMFVEGLYDADDPAAQLSLFKNQFRNMAKERFPTLSGVIDQGITPQQYFAPYSARVSKLLDRPVDFMSKRDSGIFDKIASGMPDEKFGQRTMTFAETNEYVRGLDEWQYTKNANDEARQIANNVGRMFGFVA